MSDIVRKFKVNKFICKIKTPILYIIISLILFIRKKMVRDKANFSENCEEQLDRKSQYRIKVSSHEKSKNADIIKKTESKDSSQPERKDLRQPERKDSRQLER